MRPDRWKTLRNDQHLGFTPYSLIFHDPAKLAVWVLVTLPTTTRQPALSPLQHLH